MPEKSYVPEVVDIPSFIFVNEFYCEKHIRLC